MIKSKTESLPPSSEACEEVLTVIRSTTEPLPAKALTKLLVVPNALTEKQLTPVLEAYVASGKLCINLPKTAKGKPRYWDRDAGAMGRTAALDAILQSDVPLTGRELSKRLIVPLKFSESELTEILNEFVLAGTLHAIPPATAKGKRRYWNRDALEFGRRAILKTIDTLGPQAEPQLKRAAKGLSETQFQQSLNHAVAAGDVWRHPPLGKSKKDLFGRTAPSPEPYLREFANQLTTIVTRLKEAKVSPTVLRRTLVQLIEAAGVPLTSAATANRNDATAATTATVDLVGLMRRIEPGADRGALVGSRDLRRAARLDKLAFDRAVLELALQGQLSLHRHDYATSLSPAERDELVTDGDGTYYVGMALRQS